MAAALCTVQLASLVVVAAQAEVGERFSVAAAVLKFLAGLAVLVLSYFEHLKSVRPSFLLSTYLFVSLLLDAAVVRTEWLLGANTTYAGVLTATVAIEAILLTLETVEKRRLLYLHEKSLSAESTSGPFNRGFFVWLNGLLHTGYATLLTPESLPSIYEKTAADKTHARFEKAWLKSRSKAKERCDDGLINRRKPGTQTRPSPVHTLLHPVGDGGHSGPKTRSRGPADFSALSYCPGCRVRRRLRGPNLREYGLRVGGSLCYRVY